MKQGKGKKRFGSRKREGSAAFRRRAKPAPQNRVPCSSVEVMISDFILHELPAGKSDAVREHMRGCAACRAMAAEMQATVGVLTAAESVGEPLHLSEKRRARIFWAIAHPVLDFMRRHHILVSLVLAVILATLVALILSGIRLAGQEPETESYPVDVRRTSGGAGVRGSDGIR